MEAIQKVFHYRNQNDEVRAVVINGEAWFVAKDVCRVLDIADTWNATNRLSPNMKGTHTISTLGGPQLMTIINEAGVYKLVFTSRKPEAEEFTNWIATEVIPSIRRHGAYLTSQKIKEVLADPDTIIRLATQLKQERELNLKQKQIIGELKPKADYVDKILKNKGLVTITQIAKDYGMSGQAMNNLLHKLKVQYKQSGQWLLYSEYQAKGYTHSETVEIVRIDGRPDVKMNTKWTQKGRLFLYELLKSNGVLPIIERIA